MPAPVLDGFGTLAVYQDGLHLLTVVEIYSWTKFQYFDELVLLNVLDDPDFASEHLEARPPVNEELVNAYKGPGRQADCEADGVVADHELAGLRHIESSRADCVLLEDDLPLVDH